MIDIDWPPLPPKNGYYIQVPMHNLVGSGGGGGSVGANKVCYGRGAQAH